MLIAKEVLEYEAWQIRKIAVALRCGDGMEVLNRRNAGQITGWATLCPEGAGVNFISDIWALVEKARGRIEVAWRVARRGFVGSGSEQGSRRSVCQGLPLLLRFSGDRTFHGVARDRKAWRHGNYVWHGRLGFREQGRDRVDQCADYIGGRHGRGLQGVMVIEHPSREHRFGRLLDPLVHQGGNFLAQIRRVVEPRQLKALQRGARGRLQIVERRRESRYGHGQSSNLRAGPKGPASGIIDNSTKVS
jgi:hypothetical protein